MCWSGAPRKHSPLPLSDRPLALPARPLTTVDDPVNSTKIEQSWATPGWDYQRAWAGRWRKEGREQQS